MVPTVAQIMDLNGKQYTINTHWCNTLKFSSENNVTLKQRDSFSMYTIHLLK